MHPTRVATIDLGTNTVRLLIAEIGDGGWRMIEQTQQVTRLGEGVTRSRALGEEPMRRTAAVVAEYIARAARAGARETRIVATSAVREASNGRGYVAALERATGARVEVVSGEDEARLTVRGILRGLPVTPTGSWLAFDIGGGSTEYILARDREVAVAVSLTLGVVELAEREALIDRVPPERFARLLAAVRARLEAELPPKIRAAGVRDIVGTAGTVTTLAALDLALATYDAALVQGHRLTRATIERLRDRLGALTLAQRAALPCLEPGRADLIVPGIAIVLATLAVTATDAVIVSDWGLREGIMDEVVERRR